MALPPVFLSFYGVKQLSFSRSRTFSWGIITGFTIIEQEFHGYSFIDIAFEDSSCRESDTESAFWRRSHYIWVFNRSTVKRGSYDPFTPSTRLVPVFISLECNDHESYRAAPLLLAIKIETWKIFSWVHNYALRTHCGNIYDEKLCLQV